MWQSLRARLFFLFLSFLVLVACSAVVTFWLIETQQNDATIINLAGRQRMLLQQMTRLALTAPHAPEMTDAAAQFEQTLTLLLDGGKVGEAGGVSHTLPATTTPEIRSRLLQIAGEWALFQQRLAPPVDEAGLQADAAAFLVHLDEVVTAYEAQAQRKLARLQQAQIIFVAAACLLLVWGYFIVHRHIIQPITQLSLTAQKIGAGELNQPLPPVPNDELGHLAQTMGQMQTEIASARQLLEQRVVQRTKELTTAFELSQEIVRHLEPSDLLQMVAERGRELLHGQFASVCVLDDSHQQLEWVAGSGGSNQYLGLRQSTQRGLALPVIQNHATLTTQGGCANCHFLDRFPGQPSIAAPLQIRGRSLGALCIVRPHQPFDADEARALTLLANTAAVALENARLIVADKHHVQITTSLAERERLAAELHDNLAQTLGAIRLSADGLTQEIEGGQKQNALVRLDDMQTNLRQAYTQVRMALTGLQNDLPDEGEFVQELRACVATFQEQSGVAAAMTITNPEGYKLSPLNQKQALHIIREALTNIRRHAQASQVHLTVTALNGLLQFVIQDNGIGFDPVQTPSANHLGLTIMQTRAQRSYGNLTIVSAPGQGTTITLFLPTLIEK